ncbi:MAG TPA: hypothetical protein VF094_11255 [Gaiellaceae bacterium]
MDASALSFRLIGALIVEKGLITEAQLELALEEQQATGARLGEVLMDQFGVTRADLESALTAQRADSRSDEETDAVRELARMLDEWGRNEEPARKRPIGEIFVERGFITSGQLEDALEEQKLSGRKLGEILVSQGRLSRLRLWDALEDQASSFEDAPKDEPSGPGETGLRVASDAVSEHAPARAHVSPPQTWAPPPGPARPAPAHESEHDARTLPDEAVADLRGEIAALAARLDALPRPTDDWHDAFTELDGRLDELTEGSLAGDLDSRIGALQDRVEQVAAEIGARLDTVAESMTGAASRDQADSLRHDLDTLRTSIDALSTPNDDVRQLAERIEAVDQSLAARLQHVTDSLAAAATRDQADRLRRELDDLRAALDALPAPTDDVETLARHVEQLSESFAVRLQHVGDIVGGTASRDEADALRRDLDALRTTLDESAAPGGDVDALAARVAELDERVTARLRHVNDHLASAATRDQAERLRRELDDLRAALDALPAPTDEVGALARRVDQLSESVSARLQQVGDTLEGSATRDQTDALRRELEEVRGRLDSLPRPSDEWREAVAGLAARIDDVSSGSGDVRSWLEQLAPRIEHVDGLAHRTDELSSRLDRVAENTAGHEQTDALRRELDELRGRFDALPAPTDEWREAIAALAVQIDAGQSSSEWSDAVAALAVRLDEVAGPAEELRDELGSLSNRLRDRIDHIERNVTAAASAEAVDAVSGRVDGIAHELEQDARRLDQVARRLEDLAPLHRVEELANTSADTASAHGAALDAIREELAAHARRVEEVADKRRGDKAAVRDRLEAIEASLVDAVSWPTTLESLQGHLADLDRRIAELDVRSSDIASAQSAEHHAAVDELREELRRSIAESGASHGDALDAVRRELAEGRSDVERLRAELRESADASASAHEEALDGLRSELIAQSLRAEDASTARRSETAEIGRRLESLESAVAEQAAGHQAEHRAELEALRADIFQRIDQVAATSADRVELDALRTRFEDEVSELLERQGQDDSVAEVTGQAIRDGLAELARRLTSSEQAYFESGRSLRRSIEGLGLAITDADWQLTAEAPEDETAGYVAFVPAGEGYRLVECEGPAPYLGQVVDLDGFDDVMLRVSRLGRSPLPFDGRPCAYLERLSA